MALSGHAGPSAGRVAAANDRARLARRGPVRPDDGRRASVRRTPDRRDAGPVGSILEVRPLVACRLGCRARRTIAIVCARSSAPSIRVSLQRSNATETTSNPAIVAETDSLPCVSGSLAGARRDDGRRAAGRAGERRAVSVTRGRAGCRADSRTDPRPRTRDLPPERQFARLLAESGCELVIPTLIQRELMQTADPQLRQSQQTWREWIYRQAFHMGRHPIGFEVQKVLAAVDRFRAAPRRRRRRSASSAMPKAV